MSERMKCLIYSNMMELRDLKDEFQDTDLLKDQGMFFVGCLDNRVSVGALGDLNGEQTVNVLKALENLYLFLLQDLENKLTPRELARLKRPDYVG